MAFQQPQQRPQPLRQSSHHARPSTDAAIPSSSAHRRPIEESQEWILFSPAPQTDRQSGTSQTPRTTTQRSDFGSLETHIRSQPQGDGQDNGLIGAASDIEDEDGAELDSLDDGLHAFHHPLSATSHRLEASGGTVLPTHDGFGTFPSSSGLQERLWQFERYNPHRRRHVRQRSSVQKRLDAIESEHELDEEHEKTARIEKWRLEQSRAVLEEIERETRRRQRRMSRRGVVDDAPPPLRERLTTAIPEEAEVAKASGSTQISPAPDADATANPDSFWQRITRRVIQDLIGLDERTLSAIFGESVLVDPSPTPTPLSPLAAAAAANLSPSSTTLSVSRVSFDDSGYSWEVKLLDKIARELGGLVYQLSNSDHDGRAFPTYPLPAADQLDYAGLPIPSRDTIHRQPSLRSRTPRLRHQSSSFPPPAAADPAFAPTLAPSPLTPSDAPDSSLWGIEEEEPSRLAPAAPAPASTDREYWERDIDVHMIFSYLRRRFSRSSSSPSTSLPPPSPALPSAASPPALFDPGPLPASWITTSPSSSSPAPRRERAELIKHHHPLVSRAAERAAATAAAAAVAQTHRRESSLLRYAQHHSSTTQTKSQKRGPSSCASQSTKRSRHTKSGGGDEPRRHYWLDGARSGGGSGGIEGSAAAGIGDWGEV